MSKNGYMSTDFINTAVLFLATQGFKEQTEFLSESLQYYTKVYYNESLNINFFLRVNLIGEDKLFFNDSKKEEIKDLKEIAEIIKVNNFYYE